MRNALLPAVLLLTLASASCSPSPLTPMPGEDASAASPTPSPTTPTPDLPDLGNAPELVNEVWLNSESPARLMDLRGRVVLLDFWTFG